MIIERLLFVVVAAGAGLLLYQLFKTSHIRRLGIVTTARPVPTLLYFRSDSCAVCPAQTRYIQPLVERWQDRLYVEQIDADEQADVASAYGVLTLPTTIIVGSDGIVRDVNYGLAPTKKLEAQLATFFADAEPVEEIL